ncbi:hypothetical protein H0H81_005200 [Sphagnurus paluster]|uniref:Velvet domain-containing protein n=1 Tax=Sphagnurus paluster TaxID=117069 RepID=A0A9P7FY85_9AGAR|nr:hypothetical protein H0H81_005200 [Sphagnurus paluster]
MPQSFDRHITPPTQPTSAHETSPAPVLLPQHTTSGNDIVHYVNDTAITEGSKMTYALVGAKFVQPHVVELLSKKAIVFVFADLAVKVEGQFILRYRVFDIFSRPSSYTDLAVQAECYGGSFRVYSTKEFPGLPASTELTKQLARWGVRLNTRETERRRRKKGEARSSSPPYAGTARKRKHASPSDNAETAEGSDEDEE